MKIVNFKADLHQIVEQYKSKGKIIGFVPTMGALHQGHLSLIDIARQHSDIVAVSIYVNPKQFGPNEDFAAYPRTIEEDIKKLQSKHIDILYLPEESEIYGDDFEDYISVGAIGKDLEGIARPGFFDGVATVVNQLFLHVRPDISVFGEKDFQQLNIIKTLKHSVKIISAPIIREKDGLAMSSRNVYLSDQERKIAPVLYACLTKIAHDIKNGNDIDGAIRCGKEMLIKAGFNKVDYIELRNRDSLYKTYETPAQLLAAVYIRNIRLIDNISVE
jgi:pantoate--beta-alanine ligase